MAYALVGTIGAASQGAAVNTAVTPAYGQTPTAGNLLICFVAITGSSVLPTTPSGWSIAIQSNNNSCSSHLFFKIAAGGDTAPTISAIVTGMGAAQLAEFSGNGTTKDKAGAGGSATSPIALGLGTASTESGELLVVTGADFRSAARTPNDTWTSNHGTITQAGNNNGASSVNHYSFGYCLATTSNSGQDTATMTCSVTTSLTGLNASAATFLLPPAVPLPELILQPMTPATQPR